jgi:hypothetical protein
LIVEVPVLNALNKPDVLLIVPTEVEPLLHVPPGIVLAKLNVAPVQTPPPPVMGDTGLTVRMSDDLQPAPDV